MNWQWGTHIAVGLALGGLCASAARAQTTVTRIKTLEDPAAEAELPDIQAVEAGARPRASVSFRAPTPAQPAPAAGDPRGEAEEAVPPRNREDQGVGYRAPAGIYGLEGGALPDGSEEAHALTIPELHQVKKGDTLWSICQFYFREPQCWPRLWAHNPMVTNPHWIFPGDVVRLRSPDAPSAPPVAANSPRSGITSTRKGTLGSSAVVLRQMGFIEAGALHTSGRISGSREEKIMLASGDSAYITFPKNHPLHAGERYSIYQADLEHPVKAPGTDQILGYLVQVYGDMVIDQISENSAGRGTLVDIIDPVERGYAISPAIRQFKRVEPRPSVVNLDARVVASFTAVMLLPTEAFVVLSRGKKDGLQVGNRTFVIRRADGYKRLMEKWDNFDPAYPKEVVAELLVLDVADNTSVAWIARSTKEIRVGETTELRKGY